MSDYGTPPEPKYGRRDELAEARAKIAALKAAAEQRERQTTEPRRSPLGIVLAFVLLALSAYAIWGALHGGWFLLLWALAVPMFVVGFVGLLVDIPKVPRDEHGVPLRYKNK